MNRPQTPAVRVGVLGSFMVDLVVHAPRRPLTGETLVGSRFEQRLGGKGFNTAVAARNAGADVTMLGCLGNDAYGAAFLDALDNHDIDRSGVIVAESQGTGVGLPLVEPDGDNSIVVVQRANQLLTTAHIAAMATQIEQLDVLCLQLELDSETAEAAAELCQRNGVLVLLNAAPADAATEALLGSASVLVVNESEAAALCGLDECGASEVAAALLSTRYPQCLVVVTIGSRGALIAGQGFGHDPLDSPLTRLPAPNVDVVDTVGAGDTFCGYLAAGLGNGLDARDAVALAVEAASSWVTFSGHGSVRPLDIPEPA